MTQIPSAFAALTGVTVPEYIPLRGAKKIMEKRPDILAKIVDETRRNGQWRLACEANKVSIRAIADIIRQGEIEYQQYEMSDDDEDEITIVGDFYLALKQAQALHAQGIIDEIHNLARSGDAEYKNFYLWIIENLVEGKPYAKFQRVESKNNQTITIINQAVTSDQWKYGIEGAEIRQRRIASGDIIDTTLNNVEDF